MPIQLSGSLVITGSITTTGVITMSGSIASASYSSTSDLLQGTGSVGFATTASLLEVSSSQQQISASYIALSASYTTFSGSASTRVTKIENNYATTGSNSFRADQSITGSLVVSSTITAQTLVVQTVTSSIVYSSGSNLFGNALGDRQTFTGSVNITGSLALAGNITSNGTAVVLGSGTSNYLPKFTAASTIGNSLVYDNATSVFINATSAPALGSPKLFVKQATANTYEGLLVASSANNNVIAIAHTGTQGIITTNYGTSGTNTSLAFGTNGAGQMTLDTSGNLGLGVTPSAWSLGTALEIANGAAILGFNNETFIASNAYYDGGWKYRASYYAQSYFMNGGEHKWQIAPSGSANAAITFTQAMTLNASGNLSVGNTNDTYKLDVTGTARFTGQVNSETAFYAVATPPATNGGIINVRDTVTATNVTSFAGVFFNSSPGNDYSIGKLTENNAGFLQIRNANSGAELLRINASGVATFCSSVTANATSTFSNASGLSAIFSNGGAAGNYNSIELRGGTVGSAVNWQISKDNSTANAFELAPSTTAGGTTYGSPVLKILNTGAATFSGKTNVVKDIADYAFTVTNTNTSGYGMYLQAGGTNNAIDVYNASGATQIFKLTGTGAANFASVVCAPNIVLGGTATSFQSPIATYGTSVGVSDPYTADLQLVVCHNGWGGNYDSGTLYVQYSARAYGSSQLTTSYGMVTYQMSSNGVEIYNACLTGLTSSNVSVSSNVAQNCVLKVTFAVAQNVDRISIFARTTNQSVFAITSNLV